MTSERKIRANQANARASTGPKTAQGRTRAARNALRHGLSLPVVSDPTFAEEIEGLAREIAGPDANAEIQELARWVAEAQIDLRRIRYARHQLLSHALNDGHNDSRAIVREKVKLMSCLMQGSTPEMPAANLEKSVTSTPEGPQKFAQSCCKRPNDYWPWTVMKRGLCPGAKLRSER